MITPRRTRLIRVPDLQIFRHVLATLACGVPGADADGVDTTPSRAIVVPTRGAAQQLRRALQDPASPHLVTREQLYDLLRSRLPRAPARLTSFDRAAIVQASAREAIDADIAPPFELRPGLVAEIVRFYDQLRRQRQPVTRFEELLVENLAGHVDDRGAERMLRQTRFLAATYRGYERRLAESGTLDEHALRAHLASTPPEDPIRHVVVTVGDWVADPHGLFPADFDLLTRLPALQAIDVVATEGVLASGFHQRLHEWLPGLDEIDGLSVGESPPLSTMSTPSLLRPPESPDSSVFVSRDREEELVAVVRRVTADLSPRDSTAVVFQKALPYLYLAPSVFGAAGLPYQTFDALPLAAEPCAAAMDLLLDFVASQFSRRSIAALLRSPHFTLTPDASPVSRESIAALDRALSEARYLGELVRLRQLSTEWGATSEVEPSALRMKARPALAAALAAAVALQPLLEPAPASRQIDRLISFLDSYQRRPDGADVDDPLNARQQRGQAAIGEILRSCAAAAAAHDDGVATIDDIAPAVRRWIEDETFVPDSDARGPHLLDAQAARYGSFDDLVIVGAIEGEWPERPTRNIFYPPGLLAALGWPSEKDRGGAAAALFVDLLRSPSRHVMVSTFTLDDEALVQPSPLIEEIGRAHLPVVEPPRPAPDRVFADEFLSLDPPWLEALDGEARGWAAMRLARSDASDPRYHGQSGTQPLRPLGALSVSAIETYLTCPFKYFAQYVLRLEEEPDDDEVMDPKRQGRFVHEVFQTFFTTWQQGGHQAITSENLDAARGLFAEIIEPHLDRLPDAEAALERTRLLGSSVAQGLAEVVFRMEAERPVAVVERLLEHRLEGEFEFIGPQGPRRLVLRGVADRIDLLADGTFRLIDYKLSSPPSKSRALQLPIYGLCAEQRLVGRTDGPWALGEASYIAFRGARRIVPLFTARADRDDVLKAAQEKLVVAVERIERGEFPPTPEDIFLCGFCSYAAVCRKDYVGDV